MDLKSQVPAEGIMEICDYNSYKCYKVECNCGESTHSVTLDIESYDDGEIIVNHHVTETTDFWQDFFNQHASYRIKNPILFKLNFYSRGILNSLMHRLKLTWQVWISGSIKYHGSIVMSKQQALNYAETLKQAVYDVKDFTNRKI